MTNCVVKRSPLKRKKKKVDVVASAVPIPFEPYEQDVREPYLKGDLNSYFLKRTFYPNEELLMFRVQKTLLN